MENRITNKNHKDYYIYLRWSSIKQRCLNSKNHAYKDYGDRGITMCDEWKNNSKSFIDWCLSNGYSRELEIDRIDNNGNYEPSNCRFVTHKINIHNQRSPKKKSNLPTGVRFKCKKFESYITINNKQIYLGVWSTIEEASKQYQCMKRITETVGL